MILDIVMPEVGGEELFHEFRRLEPSLRVLVSSGYPENESIPRIAMHPDTGVLAKPYQPAELLLALDILIGGEVEAPAGPDSAG